MPFSLFFYCGIFLTQLTVFNIFAAFNSLSLSLSLSLSIYLSIYLYKNNYLQSIVSVLEVVQLSESFNLFFTIAFCCTFLIKLGFT